MFEMVHLLAGTSLFLLAFSVLIFDIPRYTISPEVACEFIERRDAVRVDASAIRPTL